MSVRTVTVHLRAEVAAYLANTRRAEKSTEDLRKEVDRLNDAASSLTKAGIVGALAGVPGAIAPVAAGLSTLPAFVLTSAAAFGTLAIATNGVGDAMKAVAEGDADKMAEAMANLSTEARTFVYEYQRIKPVLDRLGDDVQDGFFRQLNGDLEMLTKAYLPTMLDEFPRLAAALGQAGDELAGYAAAPSTVAQVNRQFALAIELAGHWSRLLRAGTGLLLDMADASTEFTDDFVGGLADGTEAMRRWFAEAKAQGRINDMFANGARILDRLGDIAAQTGELLIDMAANEALTDATLTLLDVLGLTLDLVHSLLSAFELLPGPLQSAVASMLALGGAALLLAGRFAAMKAAALSGMASLQAMGPAGERAARGLERASRWAGRAAAAFIALQVAGAIFSQFNEATADTEKLAKSLEKLGKTGQVSGELTRVFGDNLDGLAGELYDVDGWFHKVGGTAEDLIPGLRALSEGFFGFSFNKSTEDIKALDQALTELVRTGDLRTADAAFTRILQQSGMSLEDLSRLLPNYTEAMREAEQQTDDTARAQKQAAERSALLSDGLMEAVRSGKQLADVFDELNGEALDWADAQDDLEASFDDASEAIAKNGRTLDVHTEKGRDNRKALRDIAEATRDAIQARYADTESLPAAIAVYEEGRQAFIRNAMAAGLARDAAEKLADEWLKMPPLVATTITTPGMEASLAKARELHRLLGSNAAASVSVHGTDYVSGRRWGGVTVHAAAGSLRDASIFSPVSPARYAFAEPATRGEAFIPRAGDYGRSMSILSTAAGWYGASVVAGGGAMAGPSAVIVQLIDPQTGAVMRQKQIEFAQSRGVPTAQIRSAHP